jgi:hypothetical protein
MNQEERDLAFDGIEWNGCQMARKELILKPGRVVEHHKPREASLYLYIVETSADMSTFGARILKPPYSRPEHATIPSYTRTVIHTTGLFPVGDTNARIYLSSIFEVEGDKVHRVPSQLLILRCTLSSIPGKACVAADTRLRTEKPRG